MSVRKLIFHQAPPFDAPLKFNWLYDGDYFFHGTLMVPFLTTPGTSTANQDMLGLIPEGTLFAQVTIVHVNNECSHFPIIQIWWKIKTP